MGGVLDVKCVALRYLPLLFFHFYAENLNEIEKSLLGA